ncbi:hypothetical protein ACFL6E_02700 [Candidatus Neomarinimicrobiota bacterium]
MRWSFNVPLLTRIYLLIALGLIVDQSFGQGFSRAYNLDELVGGSDNIVDAIVMSKQSSWNSNQSRIYTEVVLEVNSNIYGDLTTGDQFKIRHLGGRLYQ